jgi:DNA-binding response OmpR family regulator
MPDVLSKNAGHVMDRLLVIDDDRELCTLLTTYLEAEGFQVEEARDGEQGLERSLSGNHVLIILDMMLPGLNGLEVLRRIRMQSSVSILVLTARGEEVDKVAGLEVGADDYLSKPFSPRELVARIRALLRRTRQFSLPSMPLPHHPPVAVGKLVLNKDTREVRRDEEALELTVVEFNLLEVLMRSAGRVVTREELVKIVQGRGFNPLDRSIDIHVSHLRKKLGVAPNGREWIKTIRGVGYLFGKPGHQAEP